MREDEARAELQAALHQLGVRVTQYVSVEEDRLEIDFPHGTFVVRAPRLWVDWRPS